MRRVALCIALALMATGCATQVPGGETPAPTRAVDPPPARDDPSSPTTPTIAPSASKTSEPSPSRPAPPSSLAPSPRTPPSPGGAAPARAFAGCSGEGPVTFTTSPMAPDDFVAIVPYGLVVGAHVTPIDHMYFSPPHGSARDAFEVRAIADGVIYKAQPRDIHVDENRPREREWRLDIAHTCTFTSYLDLLTSLDPAIEAAAARSREPGWKGIPVKAGQVLGRIGGQTLDFGVYDQNVTLPGFVSPERYQREPWKVHTVDPFPHFEEPLRAALLAKLLRTHEPRAGKIDHDLDGRLIGNWFAAGTNGYGGDGRWDYWEGHLAIVPDHLVPGAIRFSTGNFSGKAGQFAIRGNGLDPANVSVETGLVKIELVTYSYHDADDPSRSGFGPGGIQPGARIASREHESIRGVALLQMTGPRTLKVEAFPEARAGAVEGFTPAARIYER